MAKFQKMISLDAEVIVKAAQEANLSELINQLLRDYYSKSE